MSELSKGFLTDKDGQKSSKRLMSFITVLNANVIGAIATILSVYNSAPLDQGVVYLVGAMLAAGLGTGALTAFANKSGGKA